MIVIIVCLPLIMLSGCGHATRQTDRSSGHIKHITHHKNGQSHAPQAHLIRQSDKDARQTIVNFYTFLGEKRYKDAVGLLGPQLRFEGDSKAIKYLKNIRKATFLELTDISGDKNENFSELPSCANYYAVKVYYAAIRIKVNNPKLVPDLLNPQYRAIYVIKEKKGQHWEINADVDSPIMGKVFE